MEKLRSEYPTSEQIEETLEAYRKGGDALMELSASAENRTVRYGESNDRAEKG